MVCRGKTRGRDGVVHLEDASPQLDWSRGDAVAVLKFINLFLVDSRTRFASEIRVEVKIMPWWRKGNSIVNIPRLVVSYLIKGELVEVMHVQSVLRDSVLRKLREMGACDLVERLVTGKISVSVPVDDSEKLRILEYELFVRDDDLAILFVLPENNKEEEDERS